jgi:hypothetical protein
MVGNLHRIMCTASHITHTPVPEDQHKEEVEGDDVEDAACSPGQADISQDVMMFGSLWTPRKQITNPPTPFNKTVSLTPTFYFLDVVLVEKCA